ncbi:MAG: GNAT family N-acetyltransferase [Actinomycetota bacterium]|nr:GNAT family N-acetyltransferase [Actinomycetota bacterium]MDD5668378.1 GNAT family N-acetyltransferase [Actinomycetota bacterium]
MNAVIRPAVPGDAPEVARLMYLAGKSHIDTSIYDVMFPGGMEERLGKLAALFTAGTRSWYHYSHYLVGEVDGRVAGSLCGFNELESGGALLRDALIEIGTDRAEGKAMNARMQPFYRVNPRHYEDSWVIEHVAVFPEFRGRGVIASLLREIIARGRERGFRCAELNMLDGNAAALAAYHSAGFVVVEENADEEFMELFGSPGMLRLYMEL